jgi:hypothetical protein
MAIDAQQTTAFLARLHLFRGFTPEKLDSAARLLNEVAVPPDGMVFEQGEEAPDFFFVYSGRVKVTYYSKATQTEEMVGFLDEGDYFGQEMLEGKSRKVSVQAITSVRLLRLDSDGFIELFKIAPELSARFKLALDSFNLSFRIQLKWVQPEEYVHYLTRRHSVFLLVRIVPILLALAAAVSILTGLYAATHLMLFLLLMGLGGAVLLGMLIWQYVDWSNDYFIITNRRIVYQEKVVLLYDSRRESPLEQVQSTEVDTTQLGRILGYGNVRIRTLTGMIVFENVQDPPSVEAFVLEHMKRTQSSLRQAELKSMEELIARRIGYLPTKAAPPRPATDAKKISPTQRFLVDMFHLRYEYGDTIQYRRHWWVLLTRIGFQSLLLLACIGTQVWILVQSALHRLGEGFPVLGAVLGLLLLGIVVFLWWLYVYVDWHNDIYLITNEKVVDLYRKPLGSEEKQEAPIKNILSVEYRRVGLSGILLNYGSVYIRVGDTTLEFEDVFNPSEVQTDLFNRMAMRTQKERAASAEGERQRMAEWIAAYHRVTHK